MSNLNAREPLERVLRLLQEKPPARPKPERARDRRLGGRWRALRDSGASGRKSHQ